MNWIYMLLMSFGPFALTVTNYTFPGATGVYGDDYELFDGDLEITASGSVGPIDLTVGYFTDLERRFMSKREQLLQVLLMLAIGYGSDAASGFYVGDEDSGLVNVSLGGSKDIKITDDYSLPLFGSFIYNPTAEAAFMVVGVSFLIKDNINTLFHLIISYEKNRSDYSQNQIRRRQRRSL